ncbi:hypothetical protein BJV77DRAFT_992628 [Russula vinacea]|nr:hypothetical protein BJV77DRAFT_992628 [Russula vinacea]
MLICFRVVAIWNKNKFIVGITAAVYLTNVGVVVLGKSFSPPTDFRSGVSYKRDFPPGIIRSEWDPLLQTCLVSNPEENKPNIIVTFISDVFLLLFGIVFPLGCLLWNQSIIWLAIATVAEATPVVFIILNLNRIFSPSYCFDIMFQFPSLIAMSIAATRMYRSLSGFSGSTDILFNGNGPRRGHDKTANTPATIQFNRIEVAVDVAYDQHHITCTDEQQNKKSHKSKFGNDLESAMENQTQR